MNKKYRKIDFMAGKNIEECVNELLEYKENNILVFGTFNGHKLYSDIVTLDNAYKEIKGKTKIEWDDYINKQDEEYQKIKKEYIEKIPELSRFWIEKGKEILDESKWEFWEEIVPVRLNGWYQGMELKYCLDIVKILNENGTLEETKKELYNQGHSGMLFRLVCSMIKEFSLRGGEFFNFVKQSNSEFNDNMWKL